MERSSEHGALAAALAEARPTPHEEFARQLDERVAAGFPRRSPLSGSPLTPIWDLLAGIAPRRLLFAGSGAALAMIAVATVIVAGGNQGHLRPVPEPAPSSGVLDELSEFSGSSGSTEAQVAGSGRTAPSYEHATSGPFTPESRAAGGAAETSGRTHRDIERAAEIGLLADPADVSEDSAKIFAAVHDANGIVLHSTTSSGKEAGARFELLIPSARLGDALAAFSSIDEVRSRHEATDDITRPTVSTEEELQDVQARIDSLLAQLADAEVESEREAIAAELRSERGHATRLRNQLARLHQRTTYSRVLVRIESGASAESDGAWGIGDAFHDAGHILGIAAGVTLVGLAVIAPLALLFLLAWLAQRLWLRSRRERALDT